MSLPRVSNNTPAEGPCGVTVKDVPAGDFIVAYAAHLKRTGKIELPKWSDLVKTSRAKELAPYDPDWYYVRAAAIARRVYLRGNVGVGAMRKIYGGRQRRGTIKEKFCVSGGSIPRHIFAQLEKMKILEKAAVSASSKGGRRITETGQRDLDSIAGQIKAADN